MKRIAIFILLFFLLPVLCLAEEKVYRNTDLKTPHPNSSTSYNSGGPQPQRQDIPNNKGRIISQGTVEQRVPVHQPPQSPDAARPRSDMNQTRPRAFTPVNPYPAQQLRTFEQALADAFARLTLFVLIIAGIPFLIWLICLIDVLRNEFTGNNKIIWFLVVFFLPVIGSMLYFFIGTDQKIRPEDEEEPVVRLI